MTSGDGEQLKVVGSAIIPIVLADVPEEGALLTFEGLERHGSLDVQGENTEVAVAFDVRPGSDLDAVLGDDLGPHAALAGAPARTPSDITTLAGVGRLTGAIGLFTAALAVAALVHALLVVVRLRGRELAILRALGLRRRESAVTVLYAALTFLVLGLALGLPLGVAIGRLVWRAITESIHVVNFTPLPVASVLIIAAASVFVAAAAAAWPATRVLRLRVSEALRSE